MRIGDPGRYRTVLAGLARRALEDGGCDLAELGRAFWVEEFLAVLPRRLFESLTGDSLQHDKARGLVNHLLRRRGASPAAEVVTWGLGRQTIQLERQQPARNYSATPAAPAASTSASFARVATTAVRCWRLRLLLTWLLGYGGCSVLQRFDP